MSDSRAALALSLIGVFLALALGMLLGSALAGPDRRETVYENLRVEFEGLREHSRQVQEENDQVRRRLERSRQVDRALLPLAVRSKLVGNNVGVFLCGSPGEGRYWRELEDALRLAGARLGPVIEAPDELLPLSPENRNRFLSLFGSGQAAEPESYEALTWLVRAMIRGHSPGRLDSVLRETGMTRRGEYLRPLRRFLVLTAGATPERTAALQTGEFPETALIDAIKAEGARAVAAEAEDVEEGLLEQLARRSIATVDNVDTPSGQIAAVLALAGAEGRFGNRPGAVALPPLEDR